MLDILPVPDQFQPPDPFPYPAHQRGDLIEPFANQWIGKTRSNSLLSRHWTYVPVYWTSYASQLSQLGRWKRRKATKQLQAFLDSHLEPSRNYFTISQHDDGLRQQGGYRLSQPILEFSCGGCGDIPLPLLCDPHQLVDCERDLLASFVGAVTHPIHDYRCRVAMHDALAGKPGCLIEHVEPTWGPHHDTLQLEMTNHFVRQMSRSVFALCPRGYGKTSYRLYESMHLGCIPVVIYDEAWLPYTSEIDWREIAVLVHLDDTPRLDDILRNIDSQRIDSMRSAIAKHLPDYFTMSGVLRQTLNRLNTWQASAA